MQNTQKPSRWTSEVVSDFYRGTLRSMRYVSSHSRHTTSNFGAAPNQSSSHFESEREIAKRREQLRREHHQQEVKREKF
jgi:hypothetical protein